MKDKSKAFKSCIRDEGRSFGVGLQEQIPNHFELLEAKAMVVSVGAKRRNLFRAGMEWKDEQK